MPSRNVWKVASVWLNTERKKHIFFKESWGSVACLLPRRKPLFMLANLSPLPNQCLKKRDVWMLSELLPQLEGAMFLDQGASHHYPWRREILTCFVSLCFSLKRGWIEVVIQIRWDSVFIFHMRCHDGWSSFINLLCCMVLVQCGHWFCPRHS